MPPDPRPRKRVRDKDALRRAAVLPCQITGIMPRQTWEGDPGGVDSHHLMGGSERHDEAGNLFRILTALHNEFTRGTRKMVIARLIRAYMTKGQLEYLVREKGEGWLDKTYPKE